MYQDFGAHVFSSLSSFSKPHESKVHFSVTTYEPYGVCCIQGLKISMGMHNFGEKRWGVGLLDDVSSFLCKPSNDAMSAQLIFLPRPLQIRSHTDQNTRIIG
jgi:hypothetical protein